METEDKHDNNELKVYMFGKFQVRGMNGELGITHRCSKRIIKLMAYIFNHHKEKLPILKIANALYADEEIADPLAATRNLIWRLRSTFRKVWGEAGDTFLVTEGSDYHWNEDISLLMDSEQMELLDKEAEQAKSDEEKTEKYIQAAALYTGSYMEGYGDMYWGAYLSIYYHTMYLQIVKKLAVLLYRQERYEELQKVMDAALNREKLDEELYVWLIRSLMKLGYVGMALDEYKKATSYLYENLGYTSMEKLREVYGELMEQMHEEQCDMKAILNDLREEPVNCAFLCAYGVFKKICQLERCRAEKMGISVYISVLSLKVRANSATRDEEERTKLLTQGMKKLKDILLTYLHYGDVFTGYSTSQYIVWLPTGQYETTRKAMAFIESKFHCQNRERRITLEYQVERLDH